MIFLINASNLKAGGGLQVADSIVRNLALFQQSHKFIIVLSSFLSSTKKALKDYNNIETYEYNIKNNLSTILFGRDRFLDNLVIEKRVDAALTIFGPSRWDPKCPHLCGFAMSHLVMPESPYFKKMGFKEKLLSDIFIATRLYLFRRSTKYFYTENEEISKRLSLLLKNRNVNVYTVSNYYNQIFDNPQQWKWHTLPTFDGITLLTISNAYAHKNLTIAPDIAKLLRQKCPDIKFRFVMTIKRSELSCSLDFCRENFLFIDNVDIDECPSLYEQCDIVFQPSLLESFTAVYPEAMRMSKPIVTTDLAFARSLCGKAALYYSALSAADATNKIIELVQNISLQKELIENGKERLKYFDDYNQRTNKLIKILESLTR